MDRKRVIIDTDPGVDDINAILFALLSDQFEIEAITTVHGNVDVDTCTKNALYLVEKFSQKNIPVHRGAARSLMGPPPKDARILHGNDGMGNTYLANPKFERQKDPAVSALIKHVMAAPGEITLLVLGPQTNIALAIRSEPNFASSVKELIFMGGRITPRRGVNPLVTFNIGEDPEAARIVIQETEIPITMLGQETAFQIVFDLERIDRFNKLSTEAGNFAAQITRYYIEQQMRLTDAPGGSIPDLAVMAYCLQPDLFDHQQMWIDVDTSNSLNRGVTSAGSPSYLMFDRFEKLKQEKVDLDKIEAIPGEPGGPVSLPGRTINVPTEIDAPAIVDWYQELLGKV
jgi:inosine-uridine nucleoside N-ribohydrolase